MCTIWEKVSKNCYKKCFVGDVDVMYQQPADDLKMSDNLFCQRMVENYENAPDEDKEGIPLEECLKEWGLD